MKMYLGGTPVKTMKVKHFEVDTNFCDMIASDLQAGKTGVAQGKIIVGTGKSFEFANYGKFYTNVAISVPSTINLITIASLDYPVQLSVALTDMRNLDFSTTQTVGTVVINGESYPIGVVVTGGKITVSCDKTIKLQIFYGRDNYT